ncbi:crotonobetainyl-CoA:carnitine CoA-transferase CaiB-like acyl-CoA transferase [Polymorphobacter multimanifer]|uniref:Crotonobetainyl-CoA:carnitine CoA-transferase CaiB-like acyl-CoA transferase n=1 Tax=Polymorphobacter multimanifer TaxID=1070431 RepID=A0A841LHQ5_9SPHN|nr:CoA transferase [Polymorphobacter multimanifer]MBB6228498.1 crotonobetainyl-CoA:carnitine CoA-transferase CaiB-like acyl-CoA transferase [Polymorphobacter multimanifer]
MGKLSGVRVVDLSLFLPGPMLTGMMADQGASVIKVEPPAGDPARAMGPFEAGHGVWFRNLNRGKTSVALDLKTEAGKAALWDLLGDADVMVEGFRPGVIGRLGFGAEAVRARFPRLVYCSISAFGQTGPMADHPAHDLGVQAEAGLLALNDGADGVPVVPGVPSADMAAGLTGLAAVLMALFDRTRTGEGATIDCSMLGSLAPWSAHVVGEAIRGGPGPVSARQRSLGGAAFYNVYGCADGGHVVLCGREPKFVEALLTALGRPDLVEAACGEAGPGQDVVKAFLAETFAAQPRAFWEGWFAGRDVAFAPVRSLGEGLTHAGLIVADADGAHHIRPAISFAGEDWVPAPAPPLAGC